MTGRVCADAAVIRNHLHDDSMPIITVSGAAQESNEC